jgi:hypothetical protein
MAKRKYIYIEALYKCLVLVPGSTIHYGFWYLSVPGSTVQYSAWYLYQELLYSMVLGTCTWKYWTVWCLVLVPLYSMVLGTCTWNYCTVWCLVLVPISTAHSVWPWYLYDCTVCGAWDLQNCTVWCLVLVPGTTVWYLVIVPGSTVQYDTWYLYLEVLYCSVLHMLLHPLPEESLHAVHIILLEQRVGWLGEPQSILIR